MKRWPANANLLSGESGRFLRDLLECRSVGRPYRCEIASRFGAGLGRASELAQFNGSVHETASRCNINDRIARITTLTPAGDEDRAVANILLPLQDDLVLPMLIAPWRGVRTFQDLEP